MFEQLLKKVKGLNLPSGKYALFGSSPIVVRGLRDATHDIDIVVKQEVWDNYKKKSGWVLKPCNKDEYLDWEGNDIELWRKWGPGEWDVDAIIDGAETIDGLPFVRLETVLAWKKRNGRQKDLADAELIDEYLAKS